MLSSYIFLFLTALLIVSLIGTLVGKIADHYFYLTLMGFLVANMLGEVHNLWNKKNDAATRKSSKSVIAGSSIFLVLLLPLFWHTHFHDWQILSCASLGGAVMFFFVSERTKKT